MTRVTVVVLVAAAASAALVASPEVQSPLLFGEGNQWILLDPFTYRASSISFPVARVENAAVAPDGKTFALIAPNAPAAWAVWIWKRGDPSAKSLFADGGRYSDPSFDADGRIYFSHSTAAMRPHIRGSYAQIFRSLADGSAVEQLTDEDGCHFASKIAAGELHYVHSSCSATSWMQARSRDGKMKMEVATLGIIDETAISRNGRTVLYVLNEPDSVSLWRLQLGQPAALVIRQRRTMERLRPAFGRDDDILYQAAGSVWVLRKGKTRAIASLASRRSGS